MLRMIRKSRATLAAGVFCCVSLTFHQTLADTVVLRSGAELHGDVANREQLATAPHTYSEVSILVDSQQELIRLDATDIDFIVLEDDGQKRVIALGQGLPPRPVDAKASERHQQLTEGIALMALGGGAAVFGAAFKFGESKATITSGIDFDDKSYNPGNYALMIGGGVLFVLGLLHVSASRSESPQPLQVGCGSGSLFMSFRMRY